MKRRAPRPVYSDTQVEYLASSVERSERRASEQQGYEVDELVVKLVLRRRRPLKVEERE